MSRYGVKPVDVSRVEIVSVKRIENRALWKAYALKRQEVMEREGASMQLMPDRFEKAASS